MYDAILSQSSFGDNPEVQRTLQIYALDFTAKEAVRAALEQNGLELVLSDTEEDVGAWSEIDAIRIDGQLYDSWDDVVVVGNDGGGGWVPGTPVSFVARRVPAKLAPTVGIDQLLKALDPDGALRSEAEEQGLELRPPLEKEPTDADADEVSSLAQLVTLQQRRIAAAPTAVSSTPRVRSDQRIIDAADLLAVTTSSKDDPIVRHVMHGLVSHGYLLVRLEKTTKGCCLGPLWETVQAFYDYVDTSPTFSIPAMGEIQQNDTASGLPVLSLPAAAKVGYAAYDGMEFLETRPYNSTTVLPIELATVVETQPALEAFSTIASLCRHVIRMVVAASGISVGNVHDESKAWEYGSRVADELVAVDGARSPHRWCRYRSQEEGALFGAHTDTSFLTAVPVAAQAGLEVYDEYEEEWYRPEASVDSEHHDQYVVLVPGELLQIVSRDEVEAAIHRVIPGDRLSAPVLLRSTSVPLDCKRYLGGTSGWEAMLESLDGMKLDDIHQAMQGDGEKEEEKK